MKFSEIRGHKETVDALRRLADTRRIPHAILLAGSPGIGKMRLARALGQYIHCKNPQNGDPCGVCASCLQHRSFNNPDLHFSYPIVKKEGATISKDLLPAWREMLEKYPYMPIEMWQKLINAGNTIPAIYVSESEDLLDRAALSAYQENYKIFIMWLPEKLRPEAANKLLKVIEEPFEDTVFILVSNEPAKLLPTILSRTQRFNLSPLSTPALAEVIEEDLHFGAEKAYEIARISEGSISKALDMALHSEESDEFTSCFMEMMRACYAVQGKKIKDLADYIASFGREKIIRFLTYCSRMIRENFIYNVTVSPSLASEANGYPINSPHALNQMTGIEENFSKKFSPFVNEKNVEGLSEEISRAATDIERNANAKIVLFDLFFLISRLLHLAKNQN